MAARVVVAERQAESVIVNARRACRRAPRDQRRARATSARRRDGIITCLFYGEIRRLDPGVRARARCSRPLHRRLPRFVVSLAAGNQRSAADLDGRRSTSRGWCYYAACADARVGRRLSGALLRRTQGRRVGRAGASAPTAMERAHGHVSALRRDGGADSVAPAAAGAVQDLRAAGRRGRHQRRPLRRSRSPSAAASATSARGCSRVWYGDRAMEFIRDERPDRRRWRSSRCSCAGLGGYLAAASERRRTQNACKLASSCHDPHDRSERRHPDPQRGAESRGAASRADRDARRVGPLLRNHRRRRRQHRRELCDPGAAAGRRSAPARHPVPAQLRTDGGVLGRLRACPRPPDRHLGRRPAERSARHSGDGAASSKTSSSTSSAAGGRTERTRSCRGWCRR